MTDAPHKNRTLTLLTASKDVGISEAAVLDHVLQHSGDEA